MLEDSEHPKQNVLSQEATRPNWPATYGHAAKYGVWPDNNNQSQRL